MATSNFYTGGNNGLNVILCDYEQAVDDTMNNIITELKAKKYSIDRANPLAQAPRSFNTGQGFLVYKTTKARFVKYVAFLEVCAGYYGHANIDIYTSDELVGLGFDAYDGDEQVTRNKRDIDRVVKTVKAFTNGYKQVAQFSNGETIYEKGKE